MRPLALLMSVVTLAPAHAAEPGEVRLRPGDELHFVGEVTEASDRAGARFRKAHDYEVRLLVLKSQAGTTDVLVQTQLHPRLDAIVREGVEAATGEAKRPPPAVRVDLARVDYAGRVYRLHPEPKLPLYLGEGVPATPAPPVALENVPLTEFGLFVPRLTESRPILTVKEESRPDAAWRLTGEAVFNGGRAWEVVRTQESPHFDAPADALTAWRRRDVVVVSPSDGVAGELVRRVEHRHGRDVSAWTEVRLARRPAHRNVGSRERERRHEAELAYCLARELERDVARGATTQDFARRLALVTRQVEALPAGHFRPGLEAVVRRLTLAARGELPTELAQAAQTPDRPFGRELGQSAPAFTAVGTGGERFAFPLATPRPMVAIFYKPGAKTADETLTIARAIQMRFGDSVEVVPLAVYAPPTPVEGLTVYHGGPAQAAFGVVNHPRFCLTDAAGRLVWDFPGVGGEVGYLLAGRVVAVLDAKNPAGTKVAPAPGRGDAR